MHCECNAGHWPFYQQALLLGTLMCMPLNMAYIWPSASRFTAQVKKYCPVCRKRRTLFKVFL